MALLLALLLGPTLSPASAGEREALEEAASGGRERVIDGRYYVPGPDGLLILEEEADAEVRRVDRPGEVRCTPATGAPASDRYGPSLAPPAHCEEILPSSTITYGEVRRVRIADREKYVRSEASEGRLKGMGIGAAVGLLGLFALFAGPIGWAVAAATVLGGAAIGAGIGWAVAESRAEAQPERFTQVLKETREDTQVYRD